VDGAVRRIETAYDTQGNAYLLTSYDAASGGNVVNQIQREFNGLGQMTKEWQAVNGSVNTSTSPKVQYAYSEMSSSANHSRLTSITYPNGRVITYNYSGDLANSISRLSSITDGGTTLESYEYLGSGTVVKRGHAEPGVDLTYIKLPSESNADAGDQYIGLDRFGRIADQRWTTSTPTAKDRRQYGYDRDSNRLYFDNLVETTRDELYAYDGLNQLTSMDRGTLNGGKNGLTGAASRSQDWDYDGLGNWDSLTTDGGSAQTRSHNKQNEITSISGASTPTYDSNGNLLTDETGKQFVYDAWNRLKIVKNSGGTTLATYAYDADGRRVRETRSGTTTDLFYSDQWQVLEERVGSDVKKSYVWSLVYVDAMIARDRDTDANGSLDERLYSIHDANFNVVALVETSGAVVERFAYDAFGVFSVLTPAWGSRGSTSYDWIYLHQGGRWDLDGGVFSFRHREYSPELGRWMTNDPMGTSFSIMLYSFGGSNPVRWTDSLGLATAEECERAKVWVESSHWYENLAKQFSNKRCKLPEIKCEANLPAGAIGSEGGQYFPDSNESHIYYKNKSVKGLARTMVHELIHGFDRCRGLYSVPLSNSGSSACGELRAYFFSGQCSLTVEQGGYKKVGEKPGDCLLRQAVLSIAHRFANSMANAEEIVCCVWSHCLGNNCLGTVDESAVLWQAIGPRPQPWMAYDASDAHQSHLGITGTVDRECQAIACGRQTRVVGSGISRSAFVSDAHRPALARFAQRVRRLECGVPTVQALEVGGRVRSSVFQLAA
jgi:RHS repeat-associated protein